MLSLTYTAKRVNVVAGGSGTLEILLDGQPLPADSFGADVETPDAKPQTKVSGQRLYNVVSTPDYGQRTVELRATGGIEIYTFTFG